MIEVEIVRPTLLDEPMAVLNRIRGALGETLKAGASAAILDGRPCTFDPPCALDVFFREQLRIGGRHGLPKPFVVAMEIGRHSLTIRLSVFGLACDWVTALREALVAALPKVDWAGGYRPSTTSIQSCRLLTAPCVPHPDCPSAVDLVFETPFDATGTDARLRPATIVGRLARRVEGMAIWMGSALAEDWHDLSQVWDSYDYDFFELTTGASTRGSRRQGRTFTNPVMLGRLLIRGDLRPIWPLLILGQTCHVGRGAVSGYGRFHIEDASSWS